MTTAAEFSNWLTNALPGDRCVYHVGFLMYDAKGDKELRAIANVVWNAHSAGLARLTQKQAEPPVIRGPTLTKLGVYEYRATARQQARKAFLNSA
jgi:hypothetical protein